MYFFQKERQLEKRIVVCSSVQLRVEIMLCIHVHGLKYIFAFTESQ